MKVLTQYQSKVSHLFFSFLRGEISAEKVKTELKTLEKYHQDLTQTKKELWFRFENVAFSIDEVYNDLNQQKDFLLEQIENSLKLGNDLEIYYS